MLETVAGLILMSIPLFLAFFFKDCTKGFLIVVSGLIIFHLFLAIFSQSLNIFSYGLIISINFIVALLILLILIIKRNLINKTGFKINWLAVCAFLIIGFQLWSVHYSYTGTISTIDGYQEVTRASYAYPYYSDEWIGVSLINYSIENNTLPLTNPLWPDARFANPTFPFFSFMAEIFLLLQIDPLTAYPILAILSGTLICFLSYLILRRLGAGLPASLLVALSIPYIINGANLPGIWYFIPLVMGLLLFLFSLLSFVSGYKKITFISSLLSVIFYPPIIIFSLSVLVVDFLESRQHRANKIVFLGIASFLVVFVIASLFIFWGANFTGFKDAITSLIFRNNLQSGIPKFNILVIIPFWILFLGLIGFMKQIQIKRYLFVLLALIGVIFWVVYSSTREVFIIEYQRVIVITSIVFAILAGLGFKDFIYEKYQTFRKISDLYLTVGILIIFAIASPFYTRYSDWNKLVMQIDQGEDLVEISPASPANTYLIPDDLKLFENIKGVKFLAPPWKGLVIGVATANYPLDSKASTLTNSFTSYSNFMSASCVEKAKIAQKFQISYVYSDSFDCKAFSEKGKSKEGLVLYQVKN